MHTVRWGIAGTGRMAATIAAELVALRGRGHELVGVASRERERGLAFASRFGIPRVLPDVPALAASDLDAVYVATPHVRHCEDTLACVDRRRAVLCEKPFTLNAAEAERVAAAARAAGAFVMEAMWTRFLPAVVALRTHVRAGTVGRCRLVVGGGAFVPQLPPGHYLLDPALGGGVLLDAGVYLVSMAAMLLGAPTHVHAAGALGTTGVDEQDAIVLEHPGHAHSMLYVSLRSRRPPDLEVLGESGRIRVEAPVFRPAALTVWSADGTTERHEHPVDGTGYGAQLHAVATALREGRTECEAMPLAESVAVMRTLDAIRARIGLRYPAEQH